MKNIIKKVQLVPRQIQTSQEELALLSRLESKKSRREYAMEVLGLSQDELSTLSEIRRKGKHRHAMDVLNLKSRNQLNRIRKWMRLPRHKRIEQLAPDSDRNIRHFFENVYAFHRKRKKHSKNNWKYQTVQSHIQAIMKRLGNCLERDELIMEDAKFIGTQLYYAFWVTMRGSKEGTRTLYKEKRKAAVAA